MGRSLFVIHIEIKDSLWFINERWATNELKFCMCCDLFPQYEWVCIFVCCVFTSFRPGEGAELAKPPLLISLHSGASSQTSECWLQHSHSVFCFLLNDVTFSDKKFQEWHRFTAAAYNCHLRIIRNTLDLPVQWKGMPSNHKRLSCDWKCNYPPDVHVQKQPETEREHANFT